MLEFSEVLILPPAGLGKKRHGRFTTRFKGVET